MSPENAYFFLKVCSCAHHIHTLLYSHLAAPSGARTIARRNNSPLCCLFHVDGENHRIHSRVICSLAVILAPTPTILHAQTWLPSGLLTVGSGWCFKRMQNHCILALMHPHPPAPATAPRLLLYTPPAIHLFLNSRALSGSLRFIFALMTPYLSLISLS